MPHLNCIKHGRRVLILPSGNPVHRNGDGTKCNSDQFKKHGPVVLMKR